MNEYNGTYIFIYFFNIKHFILKLRNQKNQIDLLSQIKLNIYLYNYYNIIDIIYYILFSLLIYCYHSFISII